MRKFVILALSALMLLSSNAFARNDVKEYPLKAAMESANAEAKLGSDISFYFGDQRHGKIKQNFGEFKTNKKTNAFNKSDSEACNWAFLSAMITLKDRALKEGGNAVIEIKSNYKNNLVSSSETFQCGAGNVIAGVALTGKVVTLK
ncbi:excinuclease [Vibrio sp. RC27]